MIKCVYRQKLKFLLIKRKISMEEFIRACISGDTEGVHLLLADPRVDPCADISGYSEFVCRLFYVNSVDAMMLLDNFAIQCASFRGHVEIVRLLLTDTRVNPAVHNNRPICCAAENGHFEVVCLLLADSRVNPADVDNWAIRYASDRGHIEIVRLLLLDSRVNPGDRNNWAVRTASGYYNHVEIVRLLLADHRVDPTAMDNWAIRTASYYRNVQVVKILLEDSRVDASKAESTNPEIQEMLAQWKYYPH